MKYLLLLIVIFPFKTFSFTAKEARAIAKAYSPEKKFEDDCFWEIMKVREAAEDGKHSLHIGRYSKDKEQQACFLGMRKYGFKVKYIDTKENSYQDRKFTISW